MQDLRHEATVVRVSPHCSDTTDAHSYNIEKIYHNFKYL